MQNRVTKVYSLLMILLILSCKNSSQPDKKIDSSSQIWSKNDTTILDSSKGDTDSSTQSAERFGDKVNESEPLSLTGGIEVISSDKHSDQSSEFTKKDVDLCNKWELKESDVLSIFKESKEITGTEWDLSYAPLPCSYDGIVKIGTQTFKYSLNAGSFIVLSTKTSTHYLGCESKKMYKFFISHPDLE